MDAKIKMKILKNAIKIIVIILIIALFIFVLTLFNQNKIIRGVKIAGTSVGGLTSHEAQIKISDVIENFFNKEIVLKYEDEEEEKIWTVLPEKLGIEINIESTLIQASKIGHRKKLLPDIIQQILGFFGYYNLFLTFEINEAKLENFIEQEMGSINGPAVNAGWQYNEKIRDFVQIASQKGAIIDRKDLKNKLQEKTEKLNKKDIYLILINEYPEILEDKTIKALIKAQQAISNAPYELTINNPLDDSSNDFPIHITLVKKELIPMLKFISATDANNPKNKVLDTTLDKEILNKYLSNINSSISSKPVEAVFIMVENRVTDFTLSKNGIGLDIEKNISKLTKSILDKNQSEIELLVSIVLPGTISKNINDFGITSLLGTGKSNFGGSPKNRVNNIKVGTSQFHGLLIKPDEEFSFNTLLGEVGPEQGYTPELVIKKNKTIPEYGGGLCQVSTTVFRAAINSGLEITQRYAHAFPVVYYSPQGFDATIYPPYPDLRFINNTPNHMLIQAKIEDKNLIFEFYGTDDNRKIEIDGPYQYDLRTDGSLKARLTRRIYKDDELIEEKTWYSAYKSPSLYPVQRNPLQ